jgi:hypothetical protein
VLDCSTPALNHLTCIPIPINSYNPLKYTSTMPNKQLPQPHHLLSAPQILSASTNPHIQPQPHTQQTHSNAQPHLPRIDVVEYRMRLRLVSSVVVESGLESVDFVRDLGFPLVAQAVE